MSIVKNLEWEGDGHIVNGPDECWLEEANTAFGWGYCIEFGLDGNFKADSTFDWSRDGFDTPDDAKAAAQADYEARILSAMTTDPRAMVADVLEQAAYQARNACLVPPDGGSPTKEEADVCEVAEQRIRALIDTDHAAALEALMQERAGALVAAAYEDAAAEVVTVWNDEDAPDDGICSHMEQSVRDLTPADAKAHLYRLLSEAEARGYQRGQEDEREACADIAMLRELLTGEDDGKSPISDAIRARGGESDG